MKKIILISLIVIMVILTSTALFAKTTIRITNGEWAPYLSKDLYNYGLASNIVTEAFKLEGIDVEWGFFPWIRSYEEAKDGAWDASAVWWPSKETKENFLVSNPVVSTSFVFYHLKDQTFDWNSIKDLKGLQIGITRGYYYGEEFMNAMKKGEIKVLDVTTDEQNYKKLLAGRIDIFPNDPIVAESQMRNTLSAAEISKITKHPKEFEKSTLCLIISKKAKNSIFFLEKFNSGLKKLKESGRIDQMYKDLKAGKYDRKGGN